MKVAVGSDHAGYEVKREIAACLTRLGHTIIDCGPFSPESVDYPEYAHKVGKTVMANPGSRGIVICGTGIGVSIAANKIKGIRAALCTTVEHAQLSRQHNDANVLAVGARMTNLNLILKIVEAWLAEKFEGGRHQRRIDKIEV